MTLSGATTLAQSGVGSDVNEKVFCNPQSSSITEASPSDCLVSYPGHLLEEGLICSDGVNYSTAPADWARRPIEN